MDTVRIAMYDVGERSAGYMDKLRKHGAEVTLFKFVDDEKEAASIAAGYDGLLLPGGVDVSPARYGMPLKSCCGEVDEMRDEVELLLGAAFLAARKPILGICRGCQVINILFGGGVYQDIKTEQGSELPHMDMDNRLSGTHTVSVCEGSFLHSLIGGELFVNSTHHQAIDAPAPGLTAVATAPDGIIEAVESENGAILGVQWHPELLADKCEKNDRLFSAFVDECLRRMSLAA